MSIPPLHAAPRSSADEAGFGFDPVVRIAAAQRAGLGRGLAFVALLATSSLACAYIPTLVAGPGWVEGTATASAPPLR